MVSANSGDYVPRPIRALSLGAGVQSTTIALLAKHGEIPPIDVAVFADTQWERKATYQHLWWLAGQLVGVMPVVVVTRGDVRSKWWQMPVYTDAETGHEGRVSRNCSRDYKVAAVRSVLRPLYLAQPRPRRPIDQLMGFSTDEHTRATDSTVKYLHNVFPLLYERPMAKADCLAWMERHGYPEPPKSACIGCPMRGDAAWADLDADEWDEVVAFDASMRCEWAGQGPDRPAYLHRRGPLGTVQLRPKERGDGQLTLVGSCDPGAGCWT